MSVKTHEFVTFNRNRPIFLCVLGHFPFLKIPFGRPNWSYAHQQMEPWIYTKSQTGVGLIIFILTSQTCRCRLLYNCSTRYFFA